MEKQHERFIFSDNRIADDETSKRPAPDFNTLTALNVITLNSYFVCISTNLSDLNHTDRLLFSLIW